MKSRLQTQAKALLYRLSGTKKGESIRNILESYSVKVIDLEESLLNAAVGDCLNQSAEPALKGLDVFEREAAVFHNIDGQTLERILSEMRKQGVMVELKAVTTKYNLSWKCIDLFRELEEEERQIGQK